MTEKKVIICCLDSFRLDYLKETRFLQRLAEKHKYGRLETVLGFDGIGATVLTGKHPQEHGAFTRFMFDPKDFPFKFLRRFSLFKGFFLEDWVRKLGEFWFLLGQFLKGGFMTRIYKIPLSRISDFQVSARKAFTEPNAFGKVRSLPDVLREKGIKFLFFDWPMIAGDKGRRIDFCKNQDEDKLRSLLRYKDEAQFFWIRLWDLDTAAHKFGIDSRQVIKVLGNLDRLCEKLIGELGGEDEVEFLFWSDHGMVEVKKTVDIEALFKDMKVKMFLDSTMARFWGVGGKEKKILKKLSKLPGKVLDKKDKRKFRIGFGHQKYGEIMFLADPGVLISPNYFEGKRKYKAMHGYDPTYPNQEGIYISSLGRGRKDKKMVEMFGEIMSLIKNLE